jgi:hypothetical protein
MKFCRVLVSFLLSMLLLVCFAGAAAADSTPPAEPTGTVTGSGACFKVTPDHQTVAVGQEARLNFYGYNQCPIQSNANVKINIAWGDGSTSVIPVCTGEVCPDMLPNASHVYKTADTYQPRACIDIPGVAWVAPPCLTAQVDVTNSVSNS